MLRLTELFFHSSYRIGRPRFAFGAAVLLVVSAVVWWGQSKGLPLWCAIIAKMVIGYAAMCVLSLRLHDIGRSGWWAWLIIGAVVLADGLNGWPSLVAAAPFAITLALLAVLPGQPHLNRHGPPL